MYTAWISISPVLLYSVCYRAFILHVMKKKSEIKEGDKVIFTSGNFQGLTAVVNKLNFNSTNPNAIYGIYHEVLLSNGNIGYIEKSEHWEFL